MAKLGDEYISTEHLLLALSEAGLRASADLLPDRGSLEKATAEVRGAPQGHVARIPRTACRRWRNTAAT